MIDRNRMLTLIQEQRSDESTKVEYHGADDDGQRLLAEVSQPLAVFVDHAQRLC
jgi:hypothetical protein